MRRLALGGAALLALGACSDSQKIDASQQVGPNPLLPKINEPILLPRTVVPSVVGWKAGETPTVPRGFRVQAMAQGLASPRNVYALPNGDVLVVLALKESKEPIDRLKNPFFDLIFGFAHKPSQIGPTNRIVLLRDADGDGKPELKSVLLDHLNSPFGVVVVGNDLYVAETDKIMRYPFTPGQTRITARGAKVVDLPAGLINHHWTKSLTGSPDGSKLYVGVGSNSNVGERGPEAETNRASIWEVDAKTGAFSIFASGLRNPNGLSFYPGSNVLWTVVNERDELGNNLVPDYLTSVRRKGFYGWPFSYYGQHADPRVRPQNPELVARAIAPDYALSSHVAPLGLAFYTGASFPAMFRGGAFVGEHGSWNRAELNGYKVVFIRFANGRPIGKPINFVGGFLNGEGKIRGRPVGVAVDRTGALLIADDVGNSVWRVSYSGR
ncbi:MAG: PQQ-dependent sugar dehydrogenase [Bacillota bacterium]